MKNIIMNWKHISGFNKRNITHRSDRFVLTEYKIKASEKLKNKKIVFFSDTHFRELHFPYSEVSNFINSLNADWVVFGGDLIHYMSYCKASVEFLTGIKAKTAKLAVLGNWEMRKMKWVKHEFWEKIFNESGFRLLSNSVYDTPPIHFVGVNPYTEIAILPPVPKGYYTCLISHLPGTVINVFNTNDFKKIDLILCGHTHGGQIRLPFLGALKTSNNYWKLLEYGQYKNKNTSTDLIITNGIGCTGPGYRLLCKPEIVKINFV